MAFLKVVPLEEALRVINSLPLEPKIEEVKLEEALGRVLAEDIESPIDVPPFDRATVDGYAVKSKDTWGASETNPVKLKVVGEINAGDIPNIELKDGESIYISTGAPLPKGADAVIPFEEVDRENGWVLIYKPVYPDYGVMKTGADIPKGKPLLKKGT
ncbi:MAG TPA: molybdopterin molybdenumtransferase MoeA, partial [Thermococcus paralvinellae]|nr:molybdopterin molybdenumtransferase MoeA [Thermococcus paralvinellae]